MVLVVTMLFFIASQILGYIVVGIVFCGDIDSTYYAACVYGHGLYGEIINLTIACCYLVVMTFLVCRTRGRIRRNRQIAGSCCEDLCVSLWCYPCTIAQMTTEVESYKIGRAHV